MAETRANERTKSQLSSFARRLRLLREAKFESQTAFAVEIGVAPPTYGRWERGETEPNLLDLTKIIAALEVSADFLILGNVPPPAFIAHQRPKTSKQT